MKMKRINPFRWLYPTLTVRALIASFMLWAFASAPALLRAQCPSWSDGQYLRAPELDPYMVYVVYGGAAFQLGRYAFQSPDFALHVSWACIPNYALPRDGTLLREASRDEVYVFYGGAKFHVAHAIRSNGYVIGLGVIRPGFNLNNVRTIPDGTMRSRQYTSGMVWRELSKPEVYVSYAGMKFWIPSPEVLGDLGFKWEDVKVVPDGFLSVFSDTTPTEEYYFPIRELSSNDQYLLDRNTGQKHRITAKAGYCGWVVPSVIPDGALASIPTGPDITFYCIG